MTTYYVATTGNDTTQGDRTGVRRRRVLSGSFFLRCQLHRVKCVLLTQEDVVTEFGKVG